MPVLIGTDEAGYGPNLGPLVVTATTWTLPQAMQVDDLWQALAKTVSRKASRSSDKLHVGDSKQVYSAGRSIASLERSVHAFLSLLDIPCDSVEHLCCSLAGTGFKDDYSALRLDEVAELSLPVSTGDCSPISRQLARTMDAAKLTLESIESRIIFPNEFNQRVANSGSKGIVLSEATLELVRRATQQSGSESHGWIFCDKHGGRNRYDALISAAFSDEFVFRVEESRQQSRYRLGDLEFCFRTKAEELLPVALASMVAKYVREIVMMQFNRFWQKYTPDLKPTKGYPVDAKRFWNEIEGQATELQIPKTQLWRCR